MRRREEWRSEGNDGSNDGAGRQGCTLVGVGERGLHFGESTRLTKLERRAQGNSGLYGVCEVSLVIPVQVSWIVDSSERSTAA